MEESFYTATVD